MCNLPIKCVLTSLDDLVRVTVESTSCLVCRCSLVKRGSYVEVHVLLRVCLVPFSAHSTSSRQRGCICPGQMLAGGVVCLPAFVEPVWTEILFGCMHVFPDSKLDAGIGV